MGGYSTCVILADSRSFSVPMSRRRLYLLAVQTHRLLAPLGELVSQLIGIAAKIPPVSLPMLLDAAPAAPSSTAARFCAAMDTGETRRKWREQHDAIRIGCGLPTRTEIVDKVKAHSPMAASLPLRCQELLGLHWEVAERHGVQPGDHHLVWDLTNSAMFSCAKDPRLAGVVPCALRGHCLWDTKVGRPLSGTELMRVHGFCLEPAVAQLKNSIMKKLAGDTISVAPIGCVLALALANTSAVYVDNSELLSDHHVAATWIGPSSWRGFDRSKDNLMHLAGVSTCQKDKKGKNSQTRSTRILKLPRRSALQRPGPSKRFKSASAKDVVISLD